MNRALLPAEMLHCTELAVLERQRAVAAARFQLQNQQQQQGNGCFGGDLVMGGGFDGFERVVLGGCLSEVVTRSSSVKPEPGGGGLVVDNYSNNNNNNNNGWSELVVGFGGARPPPPPAPTLPPCTGGGFGNNRSDFDNFSIARTSSCPPAVVEAAPVVAAPSKGRESSSLLSEKMSSSGAGRESFKKRKVDKLQTTSKAATEDETKDKRIKGCAEDGESKMAEKTNNKSSSSNNSNNKNSSKENSGETSKDNSKVTEVQKPDYIHVRARRGQATDSHSLAERVRREKISERMKYLQDLVPGCNKITGKAGMLDEIINYVQSLQRQVEFLSMKLAAVNPRLEFNIDNLIAKEVFSASANNFPAIGMSPDMTNTGYLQFNPAQQQLVTCGLDMGINPSHDMGIRRTISAPVSLPDTFLDASCFNQMQTSPTWDTDLQNLYNVAFDQGRPSCFSSQPFTGSVEASNLKMEM